MSTSELLDQLAKLDRAERQKIWQRLEELELADVGETPEVLAAIDAGRAAVRARCCAISIASITT